MFISNKDVIDFSFDICSLTVLILSNIEYWIITGDGSMSKLDEIKETVENKISELRGEFVDKTSDDETHDDSVRESDTEGVELGDKGVEPLVSRSEPLDSVSDVETEPLDEDRLETDYDVPVIVEDTVIVEEDEDSLNNN